MGILLLLGMLGKEERIRKREGRTHKTITLWLPKVLVLVSIETP